MSSLITNNFYSTFTAAFSRRINALKFLNNNFNCIKIFFTNVPYRCFDTNSFIFKKLHNIILVINNYIIIKTI